MSIVDQVGLTGPTYEMDIERGKIREFSRAMHTPIGEFLEGKHPVIPATFLATAAYTWGYSLERPRGTVFADLEHDLSVPLHAQESFKFQGTPPGAGDKLTCRASLEDVTVKMGSKGGQLTFLTMLTEFRDQNARLVAEERSTTVTTEQAPDQAGWAVDIPDYTPHYPGLEPESPFTEVERVDWDTLAEGEGPGLIDAGPLRLGDMVRFQGAIGEDNPLHYDVPWANSLGYPTVFGLGMHQASALAGYAAHWLDPYAVREFSARFKNVYWPGDPMRYELSVARKYLDQETGHRIAELTMQCTRAPHDPIVEAWMRLDFG